MYGLWWSCDSRFQIRAPWQRPGRCEIATWGLAPLIHFVLSFDPTAINVESCSCHILNHLSGPWALAQEFANQLQGFIRKFYGSVGYPGLPNSRVCLVIGRKGSVFIAQPAVSKAPDCQLDHGVRFSSCTAT